MLTEIVLNHDEFKKLSKGRIHWHIEQEPILMSKVDGSGAIQSGEVRLLLVVTALSKDKDPLRIITMKINMGTHFRHAEGFKEKLESVREAAKKEFPEATEGAFE